MSEKFNLCIVDGAIKSAQKYRGLFQDCPSYEAIRYLQSQLSAEREASARLRGAAEKQITRACVNAVEKLNEIAPEQGWDSGETVAEMYIQAMKRDAALDGKQE